MNVSPKFLCWDLTLTRTMQRGRAFGKRSGQENSTFVNGFCLHQWSRLRLKVWSRPLPTPGKMSSSYTFYTGKDGTLTPPTPGWMSLASSHSWPSCPAFYHRWLNTNVFIKCGPLILRVSRFQIHEANTKLFIINYTASSIPYRSRKQIKSLFDKNLMEIGKKNRCFIW